MCRVIAFQQKLWVIHYIEVKNEKGKEVTSDFEHVFFQLLSNAVFGKTCEQVKNLMGLKLTTDNEKAIKWFFQSSSLRAANALTGST